MLSRREKINHFFIGGSQYKREFRKQIRMLIIVTLGFTIAFTWRQTVFDTVQTVVQFFITVENSAALSFLTSTTVTLLAILLITITSKILQDKSNY